MAEFKARINGMHQAGDQERQVAKELGRMEQELHSIMANLQFGFKALYAMRREINNNLRMVTSSRQKIQVLAGAVEQVASLYEETERRLTGDTAASRRLKERIESLSEELRMAAENFGMENSSAYSKDPVNLCNGNYVYEKTLLEIDSEAGLRFRLFYNTMDRAGGVLGTGWVHNYEISLTEEEDRCIIRQDDASRDGFCRTEDGFIPLQGTFGSLEKTEDGYVQTDRAQVKSYFNREGRLARREDIAGSFELLSYDDEGRLERIEDSAGNALMLRYEEGKLAAVSDHAGRTVTFSYTDNLLSGITDAAGHTAKYRYGQNGWLEEIVNARGFCGLKNEYDEKGRTLRQSFPDGGQVSYEYDDEKNGVWLTQQNGSRIWYGHDSLFRSTKNTYEDGEETFTYNENNQKTSFCDKRGHISRYAYDSQGNLTEYTNAADSVLAFSYTGKNQLQSAALNGNLLYQAYYDEADRQAALEDGLGNRQEFQYNETGQMTLCIRPDGSRIEMEYDGSGNLTSITNAMGGRTTYEYDALHRVTRTTDALGHATRFTYDANNLITEVTNAEGETRRYAYDACGNLIRFEDFNGAVTEAEYNSLNKPVKVTDPDGGQTILEYDSMWNLKKEISPAGGVTTFEYDRMNRLVKVTDPNGAENAMSYDSCGNLIKRLDPNGGVYQMTYDAMNRPDSTTDPCGYTVRAEYDEMGNVTRVLFPDDSEELCEYDVMGRQTAFTDRNGYRLEYTYDTLGNVTGVSDGGIQLEEYEYYPGGLLKREQKADGTASLFEYDKNENIICVTNQDGNGWHFEYDALGRVTSACNDSGACERYTYDAIGNITSVTDGEGNRTSYAYSRAGNLTSVTDPQGHQTFYRYDPCKRLAQVIEPETGCPDPAGVNALNQSQRELRVTAYQRDLAGNVINITNPEGQEKKFTYDPCGNLLSETDADGNVTRCSYLPDGRTKGWQFADGRSVILSYDALKRLCAVEDWNGTTKIEHDEAGRPSKVTAPSGECVGYEWGRRGEKKSVLYPGGRRMEYQYDAALRLTACTDGKESVSYAYDPSGRLKEKTLPNGCSQSYTYNASGLLSGLTLRGPGEVLDRFSYRYDRNNRKKQIDRVRAWIEEKGASEYQYNGTGSLTGVRADGEYAERYDYDRFGNRIWSQVYGEESRYSYNRLNQLVSMQDSQGEHAYAYDGRGNLISESLNGQEIRSLEFDALNLLSMVKTPEMEARYTYDGFGNRIKERITDRVGNVTEKRFVYDITRESQNLLSMECGGTKTDILWDMGLLGEAKGSGTAFYLNDERMTPLRKIGPEGIVSGYQYDSFGVRRAVRGEDMGWAFTGYRQGAGDLCYAGRREYAPRLGRFISRDIYPGAITIPLTLNAYSYCTGDPLNYHDPTGAVVAWLAGGIVGSVTNVTVKFAGDVFNSIKNRKVTMSSWQSYVGTAGGGFVSGASFVLVGPKTAGAAGSAVETLITNGLNMATGKEGYRQEDGYTWKNLVWDTTVSGGKGALSGFAFGNINPGKSKIFGFDIPGVTVAGVNGGKGSAMAVWKGVMTKAQKGLIQNISWGTIGKGLLSYGVIRFPNELIRRFFAWPYNWAKDTGWQFLKDLIFPPFRRPGDEESFRVAENMFGGNGYASCPAEGRAG